MARFESMALTALAVGTFLALFSSAWVATVSHF